MKRLPDRCFSSKESRPTSPSRRRRSISWFVLAGLFIGLSTVQASYQDPVNKGGTSKAAADRCEEKVRLLEDHAAAPPGEKQTVRISEEEINSYLSLVLSPGYHPSLQRIVFRFEEGKLQATATVDFDLLAMNSKELLTKLLSKMLAGIHVITIKGGVLSDAGRGSFKIEEARFDDTAIPNIVVSEIISAVGMKQHPPFDPMTPSQMPYGIEKVELHPGFILIHQ